MKKYIALTILALAFLLTGCTTEEKVFVPNSDPENMFIAAQSLLKKEIPAARFEVDVNARIIKALVENNIDYPNYIELRFEKDKSGTQVTIIAPDDDQRKLKNLHHLLKTNYHRLKKGQNNQQEEMQRRRPMAPQMQRRQPQKGGFFGPGNMGM
ncbi:hypothetical protein ACFL4D_00040 [Candidatus Margulisiibacteriota bacterium]